MSLIKINTFILVIYLYITSISLLLAPVMNVFVAKNILLIGLIIFTIFVNNLRITRKIVIFYVLLILFITINMLTVSYKDFVFADGVNLILYSFTPIYLLSQRIVSFTYFKGIWLKLAIFFTYSLPIYYIYRQNGLISYYDIGFLSHLNILIILYSLLVIKKRRNIVMILYLITNVFVLAILGSRMVLVATVFTSLCTYFLLANKRSIKFYINTIIFFGLGLLISQNLISILIYINDTISSYGLRSRNLSMFIAQLSGSYDDFEMFLSGRDSIYPVVIEYLLEKGVFPSGFGVARNLTNGAYYHSHNFLMELMLIFGLFGFILILGVFGKKLITLFKARYNQENSIMFNLLGVLMVSFLMRSLTGTHFVTDVIFLFCLGVILSIKNSELIKR
ncbi:O-antigen polymerase [Oceanobacillus sp. M65]|uniref:O-antigen polymerase n=1 Tax=Oceanobacillus sp. M65 TaxID=3457435 RepID=UPI003FCC5924